MLDGCDPKQLVAGRNSLSLSNVAPSDNAVERRTEAGLFQFQLYRLQARACVHQVFSLALKFVLRDVAFRAIDRMPEVARELMEPAKAIREIKVLQTGGFAGGGNGGSQPMLGVMSPVLKSILEAGAAYPLLRELMQFAKADSKTLTDKAQAALDELSTEIGEILKKEEGKNGEATVKAPEPIGVEVMPTSVSTRILLAGRFQKNVPK